MLCLSCLAIDTVAAEAASANEPLIAAVKSLREHLGRPSGTRSFFPLFPTLKRWAIGGRPSGADGCSVRSTQAAQSEFSHRLLGAAPPKSQLELPQPKNFNTPSAAA